jgi:hypothetical protein
VADQHNKSLVDADGRWGHSMKRASGLLARGKISRIFRSRRKHVALDACLNVRAESNHPCPALNWPRTENICILDHICILKYVEWWEGGTFDREGAA